MKYMVFSLKAGDMFSEKEVFNNKQEALSCIETIKSGLSEYDRRHTEFFVIEEPLWSEWLG